MGGEPIGRHVQTGELVRLIKNGRASDSSVKVDEFVDVATVKRDAGDFQSETAEATEQITYNHMVVDTLSDRDVDRIFRALADRTRRDIFERVLVTGLSVSTIADDYDMSFAAVQKHVGVLERASLVTKQRHG